MKPASDVTALVYDDGLFLPLALRLRGEYKRVLYYAPWRQGFPTLKEYAVGAGFEGLERVDDIWGHLGEVDLAIFPDINQGPLQGHLESLGIAVWGSRRGDDLENKRIAFYEMLKQKGMDTPAYEVIEGVAKLREHLRNKTDVYVKISRFRRDMETWHWRSWQEDALTLARLELKFGPFADAMKFIVMDSIPADLEVGADTYNVRGKFPPLWGQGYEAKDKGYIGTLLPEEQVAPMIREVNQQMAEYLAESRYVNFWSTELRVNETGNYFIDPTCRMPCPAGDAQLALLANTGEILWGGANGEIVTPKPTARFTGQLAVSQKREPDEWTALWLPSEVEAHVKVPHSCRVDGVYWLPPDNGESLCAWLVATADTLDELETALTDLAGKMPDGVSVETESLAKLREEITKGERAGIPFEATVGA